MPTPDERPERTVKESVPGRVDCAEIPERLANFMLKQ